MSAYIDLRLRAEDEAALTAALLAAPGFDAGEDGLPYPTGHGIALDIIGTLYAETGEAATDPETGETIVLTAPLPGWHANLRIRDDHPDRAAIEPAVAGVAIVPQNPLRVWA